MFKILVMLLGTAFIAGYYIGQMPESPKLGTWVSDCRDGATKASEQISSALSDTQNSLPSLSGSSPNSNLSSGSSGGMTVEIGGRYYSIGKTSPPDR